MRGWEVRGLRRRNSILPVAGEHRSSVRRTIHSFALTIATQFATIFASTIAATFATTFAANIRCTIRDHIIRQEGRVPCRPRRTPADSQACCMCSRPWGRGGDGQQHRGPRDAVSPRHRGRACRPGWLHLRGAGPAQPAQGGEPAAGLAHGDFDRGLDPDRVCE